MTITKLSDIQLILLTTAAQREDGSLLPPPESLSDQATRIRKAIAPLLKRQLVEEMNVSDEARIWRSDGDVRIGLTITAAGRSAVGMDAPITDPEDAAEPEPLDMATAPKATSKIAAVAGLLRRDGGATLAELIEATGWLPHTTRAALTGLRKKGHQVIRMQRDGATAYVIGTDV
jgi:hypothetical protein